MIKFHGFLPDSKLLYSDYERIQTDVLQTNSSGNLSTARSEINFVSKNDAGAVLVDAVLAAIFEQIFVDTCFVNFISL